MYRSRTRSEGHRRDNERGFGCHTVSFAKREVGIRMARVAVANVAIIPSELIPSAAGFLRRTVH